MSTGQKPIEDMNKDELAKYALAEHGVELDLERGIKALRDQVAKLAAGQEPGQEKEPEKPKDRSTHLRHPTNGRVYPWTPILAARGDMIPCDKKGKNV